MPQSLTVKLDLYEAADFIVSVPDRRITVVAGTSAGYGVSIERLNSYAPDVNMTCSGLPTGATSSYNDSELSVGESATLTIGTAGVAAGTYTLSATGAEAPAEGNVVYAVSPALADVQAAIASADSGDMVRIPSGSASWGSSLAGKDGVSVEGAGIGLTVITNTHGGNTILHNGTAGHPFAYGGFTLTGGNPIHFYIRGGVKGFRIHHCRVIHTTPVVGGEGMYFANADDTDYQYGVVDNCTFTDCRPLVLDYGGGHNSWKRVLDLGGPDAIYFEDCLFEYASVHTTSIDSNYGARYVVRYSHHHNSGALAHSLQITYPGWPGGFGRGTRKVEFYENTFHGIVAGGYANWQGIHQRAGTGVLFNNIITNTPGADYYNFVCGLDNDRSFWSLPSPLLQADGSNYIDGNTTVTNGSGTHTGSNGASVLTDGTKSWTIDQFIAIPVTDGQVNLHTIYNLTDGSHGRVTDNTGTTITATLAGGARNNWNAGDTYRITDGWPALDQIGSSTDHGTGADFSPQERVPLYAWGNAMDGANDAILVVNNCGRHVRANRDYYDYTASFNGTSGVGVGLLSARPSSGLTIGVGYWATDTRTLYRATGATTWTTHYQPYAYPHPLRATLGA